MLVGIFILRLSAYLYKITGNKTFEESANLTRDVIRSQLYDSTEGYVRDTINLSDCRFSNHFNLTYNSGLYLEGISVLASTSDDSFRYVECVVIAPHYVSTVLDILQRSDQLAHKFITFQSWTAPSGIIVEGTVILGYPRTDCHNNMFYHPRSETSDQTDNSNFDTAYKG